VEEQQQAVEYRYLKSKAEDARGSLAWYTLPFMLLIRPDRFMLSWGFHANIVWILIAGWLIGASGMINTVINRVRLAPDSLPIAIDSWTTVWMIVIGFGILRGVILGYGLGGLWTWLRLRICGIRGNEWKRSTQIFCFSQLFEQSASLLALLYFTMKFDTLRDFISQPVSLVNLVAGLFVILSPIIAFVGVLACYKLRVVWATILFLVVPMTWRLGMLAALGYALLTSTGTALLPDYQNSVSYAGEQFAFDHPGDWAVLPTQSLDEHSVAQVETYSQSEDASMLIRVLRRDGIDPNDHDLGLISTMGYTVVKDTVRPDAQLGILRCYSVEYDLTKDGKRYKMLHLVAGFDDEHGILIRMLTTHRYWDASIRVAMQIINSLVIQSIDEQPAGIAEPIPKEKEWFTCQSPSNWTFGGKSHAQFEAIEIIAFGDTSIRFTVYDRSGGDGGEDSPEKELNTLLEYGMHKDRMISHSPLNSWFRLTGVGAQGKIRMPLNGVHDFWAIFVPLEDGRVLGIKKYQAESSAELTDPGFELVESTFQLLVEPAPVEP
jgi:hypothetical protein